MDAPSDALRQMLVRQLSNSQIKNRVQDYTMPYRELMSYYRCAMMEVETKFNVLNEELSLMYDRNPIESVKSRLKSPESIVDKAVRKGIPFSAESIEKNLSDIAGVRVICSFPGDIYMPHLPAQPHAPHEGRGAAAHHRHGLVGESRA